MYLDFLLEADLHSTGYLDLDSLHFVDFLGLDFLHSADYSSLLVVVKVAAKVKADFLLHCLI